MLVFYVFFLLTVSLLYSICNFLLFLALSSIHIVIFYKGYVYHIGEILKYLALRSGKFKQLLWKAVYNKLSTMNPSDSWTCMNYGYHEPPNLFISERSEEVYCLQLYHIVASAFKTINNFNGLDILEVGSGRGGGLAYVTRTFNPKSATGVDLSQNQVELCNKFYNDKRLKFVQGNAMDLPIEKESKDVVINVESSHCYPDVFLFFKEVYRVLKRGGKFYYTDFMRPQDCDERKKFLENVGFRIVKKVDITKNILFSMDMEEERKAKAIDDLGIWKKLFLRNFLALKGSMIYEDFKEGNFTYLVYELVKD